MAFLGALASQDITKAKELLSWRPLVSIEDGIQRTVEWYLENQEWVKNVETLERYG